VAVEATPAAAAANPTAGEATTPADVIGDHPTVRVALLARLFDIAAGAGRMDAATATIITAKLLAPIAASLHDRA